MLINKEPQLSEIKGNYPDKLPIGDLLEDEYDHEAWKKHYEKLILHIRAVQAAGAALGVSPRQLEVHDLSKFSLDEFGSYAMHFEGGGAPVLFENAWHHHLHHNPHHWQHWIFPDGFAMREGRSERGVLPMPRRYALEMVADWMGAGFAYAGSWDMSDWLRANLPKIVVHSQTAAYLRRVLTDIGYGEIVRDTRFKSELAADAGG